MVQKSEEIAVAKTRKKDMTLIKKCDPSSQDIKWRKKAKKNGKSAPAASEACDDVSACEEANVIVRPKKKKKATTPLQVERDYDEGKVAEAKKKKKATTPLQVERDYDEGKVAEAKKKKKKKQGPSVSGGVTDVLIKGEKERDDKRKEWKHPVVEERRNVKKKKKDQTSQGVKNRENKSREEQQRSHVTLVVEEEKKQKKKKGKIPAVDLAVAAETKGEKKKACVQMVKEEQEVGESTVNQEGAPQKKKRKVKEEGGSDRTKPKKKKKQSIEEERKGKKKKGNVLRKKIKVEECVTEERGVTLQSDVVFLSEKTGNKDEITIDQERRLALQKEIDEQSQPKDFSKPAFGQWGTAHFSNTDQQQKFLRLMGGFKRGSKPIRVDEGQANMALGKEGQQSLQQGLLGEFERAKCRRMDFGSRGAGLGFSPPSNKKVSIDINVRRSVRFDD